MNTSQSRSNRVAEMFRTHPQQAQMEGGRLAQAVEAISQCATVCTICADACLGEQQVQQLVRCIRLNLDCADICQATANGLARLGESDQAVLRAQLQACEAVCRSCGSECEQHAQMHEHCRVCAESCRHCEQVCRDLLSGL
ncbi:MAG: four-helix bundle copper-binding protein [Chloroflexi bacterium]|nr:MAG: four-helix bundle copper-binding protein [Chloroflexota bacterium]